ncbi:hypothetical protein Pelo_3163 [Pelomyxa schiedti]|nr:hypothetical protein Pelo_3163 [Pelomyxa schiedti]
MWPIIPRRECKKASYRHLEAINNSVEIHFVCMHIKAYLGSHFIYAKRNTFLLQSQQHYLQAGICWRAPSIVYKKNELFLDFNEHLLVQISPANIAKCSEVWNQVPTKYVHKCKPGTIPTPVSSMLTLPRKYIPAEVNFTVSIPPPVIQ